MKTMNIYAKKGTKVRFMYPNAGNGPDIKKAEKHLKLGKTYTVDHTYVYGWRTEIYLEEVSAISFNPVQFEDVV